MLKGLAAGAVVAFDPVQRSWVPKARAQSSSIEIPALDGELVVDPAVLAEAADDFGHIVHRLPVAVLRPGSIADIQRLVRFANDHDIHVSMRGQGHSTHGQAQALAGVVIDSRTLDAIEEVSPAGAVVGPGTRWIDVLTQALEQGLTPPVLTDYIELSVGGTLSVGGIGGHSHRHGLQVDNVIELTVVTGEGDIRTCSATQRPELFNAVLGGLGQFALIVRVKLKLIPAETNARVYLLFYDDLATFTHDQQLAMEDERFHYLEGQAQLQPGGGFRFMLEAAAYYTPPQQPDDAALLAGLSPIAGATQIEEYTYFDWSNRLAPQIDFLRSIGLWDVPHPFFDVFIPAQVVNPYVSEALDGLTMDDTGGGPILCYPFKRSKSMRPFVMLPHSDTVFLFDILRFAPDPAAVPSMVEANLALFRRARRCGGKRYAIGSIPFTFADWLSHFGFAFFSFAARKAAFDPRNVLTPGQGIFRH